MEKGSRKRTLRLTCSFCFVQELSQEPAFLFVPPHVIEHVSEQNTDSDEHHGWECSGLQRITVFSNTDGHRIRAKTLRTNGGQDFEAFDRFLSLSMCENRRRCRK
ncbi:hypothetical protein AOLI_G00172050 [Acnodon oligacanthus]